MRKLFVALLMGALTLGLGGLAAPAQAAAFDISNPPARYSAAYEKSHTLKGVQAPKGKLGYNPNARLLTGPYYFYAGASQYLASTESAKSYGANLHIQLPYMDTTNDSHTLGEIAVQSHDQQQAVEIGWTHDLVVCGAGNSPCLFAGAWKNGVFLGYNTQFVDWAATAINLGATLPTGTPKRFLVMYDSGVWWVAYDSQWIGYFPHNTICGAAPGALTFDKFGVAQGFYEVATKTTGDNTPCTDMGNGEQGNSVAGTSARVGTSALGGTLPGAIANNFTGFSFGTEYTHNTVSAQTTRAGGPGYNAAGTGVGSIGSC